MNNLGLTESAFDQRAQQQDMEVASVFGLSSHNALTNQTTLTSDSFVCNGVVKQYKYIAPNLTTDTQFSFTINDKDGGIVYSSGNLADNKSTPVVVRIAEDSAPILCSGTKGYYTITITWSTGQDITANAFKILLSLTNN